MKISIIMPTYNDEKLIGSTIQTVLSQTYTNWELLIMDDGSADATASVVRSFSDPRIRLFQQENKGQLVALNNLCQYITGDLVLMLHSDDRLYSSDTLEKNIVHFSDPQIDGLYSDFHQFFNSGKPDEVIVAPKRIDKCAVNKLITRLGSNIIFDHFFVRRDKFESNVRYNYFKWYMPYWLNFTGTGVTSLNLKYTYDPWYHYRVYDQNYTNSIIGNFEVYFTRFRSIFFLSEYITVPFPLIQKEISRRFNLSGMVLNKKASNKHLAACYRANIRSMRQRTENAYTWYFEQLETFYRKSSKRDIQFQSPIENFYTSADARKFFNDLRNNTLPSLYKEMIDQYPIGFDRIIVKSTDEAQKMEEILKFLCIRAKVDKL